MEFIPSEAINILFCITDGFTLSYVTDSGKYYSRRYIGYVLEEAEMLFREYIYTQERV